MKTHQFIFRTLFATSLLLACSSILAAGHANDSTIVREINESISNNPSVAKLGVEVSSQNGVVALKGTTRTDKEASTVVELAESATGVKEVDTSQLQVEKSEHPLDDTYITAKVKGVFARNKLFGHASVPLVTINVETKNGVVYLTGTADNKQQIKNAIDLAKTVKGVKGVDSKVVVKK